MRSVPVERHNDFLFAMRVVYLWVCLGLIPGALGYVGEAGRGGVPGEGRAEPPSGLGEGDADTFLDLGTRVQRAVKYASEDKKPLISAPAQAPRTPKYVEAMEDLFRQVKAEEATAQAKPNPNPNSNPNPN